jgi:hypothetical protein
MRRLRLAAHKRRPNGYAPTWSDAIPPASSRSGSPGRRTTLETPKSANGPPAGYRNPASSRLSRSGAGSGAEHRRVAGWCRRTAEWEPMLCDQNERRNEYDKRRDQRRHPNAPAPQGNRCPTGTVFSELCSNIRARRPGERRAPVPATSKTTSSRSPRRCCGCSRKSKLSFPPRQARPRSNGLGSEPS